MTIGEANDLNKVLSYVLGLPTRAELDIDDQDLYDDACDAAGRLAKRANGTLGAGLTAEQVEEAWGEATFTPVVKVSGPEDAS